MIKRNIVGKELPCEERRYADGRTSVAVFGSRAIHKVHAQCRICSRDDAQLLQLR